MTCQELLNKLQAMTPDELRKPVEIAVRTYTRTYPDYCYAFDFKPAMGRIYCSFGQGVSIVRRKSICATNS